MYPVDEKEANVVWLENMHEQFLEVLEMFDWKTAELVIRDVEEFGFDREAGRMRAELRAAQIEQD